MKVARCPDQTCEKWHCCVCHEVIAPVERGGATEMPPMIGDFMVCWACFNKRTSED
jgi:hypothetical protein